MEYYSPLLLFDRAPLTGIWQLRSTILKQNSNTYRMGHGRSVKYEVNLGMKCDILKVPESKSDTGLL